MASRDSQIDKPRGCPKRAELPDVDINTGTQSINSESASLRLTPNPTQPHGLPTVVPQSSQVSFGARLHLEKIIGKK